MWERRLVPVAGAVMTIVVTALGWWLSERGTAFDQDRKVVVLLTGVLLAMAIPALVGMWRRPTDRLPQRLLVAGLLFAVGHYRLVEASWASALGAGVWLATPVLLILWLTDRDDVRRTRPHFVSVAFMAPIPVAVALLLCSGPHTRLDRHRFRAISWIHNPSLEAFYLRQPNPFAIWPHAGAVRALTIVWWVCIAIAALWVVTERGRSMTTRGLVLAATIATAVLAWPEQVVTFGLRSAGQVQAQSALLDPWLDPLLAVPAIACACVGGVAVWRELVRPRLSRTDGGSLRLADNTSREALRRELVRTLGDPTVRIAFQSEDGWIDEHGRPLEIGTDKQRGVTVIRRDGVDVAALDHDLALVGQPDLVQVAATSLAMSIEAQRMAAIAAAASEDVRESAARLLAAAESGRLDVEQLIVAGPDAVLASVDELLDARPLDLTAIHDGLRAALTEVRQIARGTIPASLDGEGLRAALDDLRVATDVGIDVQGLDGIRRPFVVEATLYRVVADCAQSASNRVVVTIDGSDGEVNMRVVAPHARLSELTVDRVQALGGRVHTDDDAAIATLDVAIPMSEV
jgi:hypothetical protein